MNGISLGPLSNGLDIVRKILSLYEIATVQTTSIDQTTTQRWTPADPDEHCGCPSAGVSARHYGRTTTRTVIMGPDTGPTSRPLTDMARIDTDMGRTSPAGNTRWAGAGQRRRVEARFMLPWSFSEEAAGEKYMPQLQHNMWVVSVVFINTLNLEFASFGC
jgi:hypothetical protein